MLLELGKGRGEELTRWKGQNSVKGFEKSKMISDLRLGVSKRELNERLGWNRQW